MIGNGNVALDVARMLALTPASSSHADDRPGNRGDRRCDDSRHRRRRPPRPDAASWTTPELKELGELAGADVVVDPAELELDAVSEASLEHDTNSRRNLEVLRDFAAREPTDMPVTVRLRFLVSPVALHGDEKVQSMEVVRNRLEERDGRLVAVPTDERETIECGLVFRSVGYRGVGLPELPFDERRGTIRNERGRVVADDGEPVGRTYCAGWIKRGPTGIIGTNKKDATETVAQLLEDVEQGKLGHRDEVDRRRGGGPPCRTGRPGGPVPGLDLH